MRRLTILILMICCAHLGAQDSFFSLSDATEEAESEEKPIVLIFSGSDWCKPCIALKKTILETNQFQDFSKKLVMLHLDFPYKKTNRLSKKQTQHNEDLAEKFNPQGQFPKVILINAQQERLGEVVYQKDMEVDRFIKEIQTILQ
ncbi:MAG: thioredoxin family protein [Saprospiraceae bacterium]|nr:thioredoxin family protein [Saprospiraceae bacterium]